MRSMALAIAALALSGCGAKVDRNTPAQFCESLDGADRFVVDPADKETKAATNLFGTDLIVSFRDQLSGWSRTMTPADFGKYKCRNWDGVRS